MRSQHITHKVILRVLGAGFALVIILLLIASTIGVRNIRSIREDAAQLVREQLVTNRLLDEIQHQEATLGQAFSTLARDPDSVDPDRILSQLNEVEGTIDRIVEEGLRTRQRQSWQQLAEASAAFSEEARRILAIDEPETFASRELFRRHERVIAATARLIAASYHRAIVEQSQIDRRSEILMRESVLLLGSCLGLALLIALVTVRMTTQLFRRMEWQTGELSRVSWHLLENQETTARRFSHELHDELGQSLSAVKANLSALEANGAGGGERLRDCFRLVDEAIGNVRQLSQLLRPTILDDFGLDAGLRWLGEGFTHRTGIEVEYHSNFDGRLPDETETHLFRIAQEALTNVARHSGAQKVEISLESGGGEICLRIRDDGQGLPAPKKKRPEGMGMIGMRARARSTGGDLHIRSKAREGVEIEVRVPVQSENHERNDPHPVS
ncbi:MAG TPA: ATP-binding protein [Bryobacteraceae bacterium]|jgi:signal transduction histidine kinase|nr:ATP-binding protein [Bryobacteraceae bacterium]